MRDLEPRAWLTEGNVRALRRDLRRVLGLSTLVLLGSVVAIPLLDQVLGALLSVIAGASLALLVGAVIAYVLAPVYARQWQGAESRLSRVWPYIYRVTIWGLAAAGFGVLLAEVVPLRVAEAFTSAQQTLSVQGTFATIFGAAGVAIGILEEWRREAAGPDDS
jgi:membrane protease YdiL (CAAX protease family)